MKKRLLCLLAISLIGAFPLSAWADFTVAKTADGTEFKFGLREKFVVFTLNELDLVDNFNFRSFTSPDTALGQQGVAAQNFANLLFTVERGPLSIHANLEMEAGADAASTDVNNINLERIALRYKIPTWGTLTAGLEVRAFDPEGALIYTDEHPGLWLIGGTDQLSWDIGWHRVLDCNRGGTLFTDAGVCKAASATDNDTDDQSDIFAFRVNYQLMPGTTISPLFVYYRRRVDQAALREFSCPFGSCTGAPTSAGDKSDQDQFRPGVIVKSTQGAFTFTGEVVGLLGSMDKASTSFLGGTTTAQGKEFDFRSFALFFEVAMDGKAMGLPGWTPYLNFEWHSGDDDPFDDKLSGYVPISNLSAALRKDGFKGQSISAHGPATLGANSEDGWGFDVSARGVGPTIGSIVPDETLGSVGGETTHFNNRGGKAGNAGFFKVSLGALGKPAPNWDTHLGISAFWFDATEAIQTEAAQNCIARATFGCAGGAASAGDPTTVRNAISSLKASGVNLDSAFMGVEINANLGYTINNFRIQPFVSVFIPGSIVDDINNAFLGVNKSETAFTAGVEFSASF